MADAQVARGGGGGGDQEAEEAQVEGACDWMTDWRLPTTVDAKVPPDPRTNLRALRRFYGTCADVAVVALRREAGGLWKRYFKRFKVTETVVLDAAFGWHGADRGDIKRALGDAVPAHVLERRDARADDVMRDDAVRKLAELAKRGIRMLDIELPERSPEGRARIDAYVKSELRNDGSFVAMVAQRVWQLVNNTIAQLGPLGRPHAVDLFLVEVGGRQREGGEDGEGAMRARWRDIIAYAAALRRSSETMTNLNVMQQEGDQVMAIVRGFRKGVHCVRNGTPDTGVPLRAKHGEIERSEAVRRLGADAALTSMRMMFEVMHGDESKMHERTRARDIELSDSPRHVVDSPRHVESLSE